MTTDKPCTYASTHLPTGCGKPKSEHDFGGFGGSRDWTHHVYTSKEAVAQDFFHELLLNTELMERTD